MDIGKMFEVLNEDYRDIILSIAIGFPVAYMDCWKLQPAFKAYDLMPQIFLALSVSVLFVALGAAFCILAFSLTEMLQRTTLEVRYRAPRLLILFFLMSLAILSGQVRTAVEARIYFSASFVFAFACYGIIYRLNNRKGKRVL